MALININEELATGYDVSKNTHSKLVFYMLILTITIVIDISVVKIYDLIDKYFLSADYKILLFSINSAVSLFLQFMALRYLNNLLRHDETVLKLATRKFYSITFFSLVSSGILIGILIYQQIFNHQYDVFFIILIVLINYGIASIMLIILTILFIKWYRQNHSFVVLLFLFSLLLITSNLIFTAVITSLKVNDRPHQIREFVGGSIYISTGKYFILDDINNIFTFLAFAVTWVTTSILIAHYRNKLLKTFVYLLILSLPFIYFLINYLYRYIFGDLLNYYLTIDPITISIILTAFLSLSKPIGGLTFAIAFWKIARITKYHKNLNIYLIVAGWGLLLIFGTNQGATQTLTPYPPFGLVTITILVLASYFILIGIYNSATLVSTSRDLRDLIIKHTEQSNLLDLIGKAELEMELHKTIKKIVSDKDELGDTSGRTIDVDENELKKYLDSVIREVKKGDDKQTAANI